MLRCSGVLFITQICCWTPYAVIVSPHVIFAIQICQINPLNFQYLISCMLHSIGLIQFCTVESHMKWDVELALSKLTGIKNTLWTKTKPLL